MQNLPRLLPTSICLIWMNLQGGLNQLVDAIYRNSSRIHEEKPCLNWGLGVVIRLIINSKISCLEVEMKVLIIFFLKVMFFQVIGMSATESLGCPDKSPPKKCLIANQSNLE